MAELTEVRVPDIGDFEDVEIIEVLVAPGDRVTAEQSLITLETEKATMEVPAPAAGTVHEVAVQVGDRVSEGDVILRLEQEAESAPPERPAEPKREDQAAAPAAKGGLHAEVLVLGAGPGGYTAAFRAADLGKRVVLVEAGPTLGGVCLNVGCIPSKALLHVAQVVTEAHEFGERGVRFGKPEIDRERLVGWWKQEVVKKLTDGLAGLARRRQVQVVHGYGRFTGPNLLEVEGDEGRRSIRFDSAIIAAGSRPAELPSIPAGDPRVLDSTGALDLPALGGELLVIGGGIIALEMAAVYHALGTRVTVAVRSDNLLSGLDPDLVRPLQRRIQERYAGVLFNTRVTEFDSGPDGLEIRLEGPDGEDTRRFDHVLVAIGRRPNGNRIGAENAGVEVDGKGFIPVDGQQRTNVPHIYAIGDVVGDPMLAHKASHQGKIAAEAAAGQKAWFDVRTVPSIAYTDPEVAWAGVTEPEAKAQGMNYGTGAFPWAASGRSLSIGRDEGLTKLLFDRESGRLIGAGMVGPNAGELIAEAALAIEMGADAEDIALTVHPHPTLSETFAFAAEAYAGTITDLYLPKR